MAAGVYGEIGAQSTVLKVVREVCQWEWDFAPGAFKLEVRKEGRKLSPERVAGGGWLGTGLGYTGRRGLGSLPSLRRSLLPAWAARAALQGPALGHESVRQALRPPPSGRREEALGP